MFATRGSTCVQRWICCLEKKRKKKKESSFELSMYLTLKKTKQTNKQVKQCLIQYILIVPLVSFFLNNDLKGMVCNFILKIAQYQNTNLQEINVHSLKVVKIHMANCCKRFFIFNFHKICFQTHILLKTELIICIIQAQQANLVQPTNFVNEAYLLKIHFQIRDM